MPVHIVVMGVSGCGKSTVAAAIRDRLGFAMAEGDDFHPQANIDKMSAGIPLEDGDRWPWLRTINAWMRDRDAAGVNTVVSCSALKRAYRDVLRNHLSACLFIHLDGSARLLGERLGNRRNHFMPPSLLGSQLAILEPLQPDERGVAIAIDAGADDVADRAIEAARATLRGSSSERATMEAMTLSAAPEWRFSGEQGKANYERALRDYPAQAIVDLAALRDNMRHLVEVCGGADSGTAVMGVVKADAYGHGLVPTALAALAGGATWLGTAQAREALALRRAGIGPERCRILAWMYSGPAAPLDELITHDIDVAVGSLAGIDALADAARAVGRPARVHVKVDSGFGRNGFTDDNIDEALSRLASLQREGAVDVVGQFSHLAVADAPDVPEFVDCTDRQIDRFNGFTERMRRAGLEPRIRHLANTAATLTRPSIHFELTRPGIGLYGYEPDPAMGTPSQYRLRPAMTLQAQLGTVKHVAAAQGISYGRTYLTDAATSTAIVPIGYADGIHRSASGFDVAGARHVSKPGGPVRVMTNRGPMLARVSGRVCMDQFVLDLHGSAEELGVNEGDTVVLFGPGHGEAAAEPTADDWARSADTISYEIFTCLRSRIPRLYLNAHEVLGERELAMLDPASLL